MQPRPPLTTLKIFLQSRFPGLDDRLRVRVIRDIPHDGLGVQAGPKRVEGLWLLVVSASRWTQSPSLQLVNFPSATTPQAHPPVATHPLGHLSVSSIPRFPSSYHR